MKNLADYVMQFEKTYEFKIKIAGIELNNDALDRIEHALKSFDVAKLSAPKRLPICDKPLDFPSFGPVEVSILTATLKYPCTDEQIRTALGNQGRFPLGNVVVVPCNSPEEQRRDDEDSAKNEAEPKEPTGKSILEKEIEMVKDTQIQVGMSRVDSMLKDLESRRMEFDSKEKTKKAKTTNDEPMNNKSVVSKGKK